MKLAVDVSSLLWTNLRAGIDPEGRSVVKPDGKKQHVNTAAYGYERAVDATIAALDELCLTPIDMVLVTEGLSSKAPRLNIFQGYKASTSDKAIEEYAEFDKLREMYCEAFRRVGALRVTQDYAEGDDVLGWLAVHSEEHLVIMTNDNDMTVLNGVNTYGAHIDVRVNGVIGVNKYGDFPFKYVTLYKSLVGDTTDKISGIPGFGPKAWEQLVTRFGTAGMDLLIDLVRKQSFDALYEDSRVDKFVAKIYEGAADMIRSFKLATIYPEWVDTMNNPLKWQPGMVHGAASDRRLSRWSAARRLVTAANWEQFKPWALKNIRARPFLALDIETSTPPESDDWLIAQGDPDGVDVIGSELTGMSLTFGSNMQYTVYISVNHTDTANVASADLRDWLAEVCKETGVELVIHNTLFEGPVLYQTWGEEWKDNGYRGFLPNWNDTRFCASYVDENDRLGLKHLSKKWLNYEQVDYKTTTTVQGLPGTLTGGRSLGLVKVVDQEEVTRLADSFDVASGGVSLGEVIVTQSAASHEEERVQYKMNELSAQHVFDYACDDTVTTAALYVFFKMFMHLEHTYRVLKEVEIAASYLHAHAFVKGAEVDLPKLQQLISDDTETLRTSQAVLDAYLVSKGWDGTVLPKYSTMTVKDIKEVHLIVTGQELETAVRTPHKALFLVEDSRVKWACTAALQDSFDPVNELVAAHFQGRPILNLGSPKQLQRLMYETMALPIKVYNPPTEVMRKQGLKVGTPKTDNLAITYALLDADDTLKPVLEALRIIKMVNTRFGLFYDPLPGFVHWKTGRVHSSHNQCATNTRRASSSKPNLQQLGKHEKVEGFSPRIRELYVPHKRRAIIISFDFSSQELVLATHWSKDPGLMSCFVGDNLVDMHSMTGVSVCNRLFATEYSYAEFREALESHDSATKKRAKKSRSLGKAVNFGGLFRIAAKKLSTMLLVTESEAQGMIDAKAETFPVLEAWSVNEMEAVKGTGKVHTVMGAVRHLREALMSSDRVVSSKAPRQTLSFRIQGSAAEQTKLAEGRMWKAPLFEEYDCAYFAAIHDESVWSVMLDDAVDFIQEVYPLMTAPYATMEMPVRSSCSIGWDFGQQVELNGDFSKENIYKALGLQLEEIA